MLRLTAREAAALTQTPPGARRKPVRRPQKHVSPILATAAVREIVLELPLPPTGASTNNHDTGRGAGRARAAYRAECLSLLPRVTTPMFRAATISMEFWQGPAAGRYRARDEQRAVAATCPLVDALVDAGYLPDDSARFLHWGETVLHSARESAGRACVRVTLTRRD